MSDVAISPEVQTGWVRNAVFDPGFILGTVSVGLLAAAVVTTRPNLFGLVLFLDFWLLGYHHVIATFTRIAFDRQSFRENRFFVLGLPWIVLGAVVAVWFAAGTWALTTIYFYWQWLHYTRQSYGVERIYWRTATKGRPDAGDPLTWHLIYGLPLWGILERCAQGSAHGTKFLMSDVLWLPVPVWLAHAVGVYALGVLAVWTLRRIADWRRGELRVAHTLYVASHVVIFTSGYVLIEHVDYGWLAVNIWHNAQYIAVVWMFNTNRFKAGIDASAPFLSEISQPRNVVRYFLVMMSVTALVYLPIKGIDAWFAAQGIAIAVVLYQTVNFHHYVVDSFIWKLRKKSVRSRLTGSAA